ncbi:MULTISPECIES: hypothetical protein [Arthrobacter]|uniref:Uncharacterized protein n=1 Tax=Arthrobacter terricola TaxID=2547396 RepID=A0A4R5KML0_9MICC|nr:MULTISPECIES: hypothetical protein [Arthrobacter]MBT8160995.1 hypothetical protein [Arthrobacter sp. GN70]TDF96859.1 hypothetical protein E1809_09045 [Arthrobacter terricola]
MTAYAASSVTAFAPGNVPCNGHLKGEDDERFIIDCPVCEPLLAGDPFWATSLEEAPLTGPEMREAERKKAQGSAAMAEFSQAFMANFMSQQAAAFAAQQAEAAKAAESEKAKAEVEANAAKEDAEAAARAAAPKPAPKSAPRSKARGASA